MKLNLRSIQRTANPFHLTVMTLIIATAELSAQSAVEVFAEGVTRTDDTAPYFATVTVTSRPSFAESSMERHFSPDGFGASGQLSADGAVPSLFSRSASATAVDTRSFMLNQSATFSYLGFANYSTPGTSSFSFQLNGPFGPIFLDTGANGATSGSKSVFIPGGTYTFQASVTVESLDNLHTVLWGYEVTIPEPATGLLALLGVLLFAAGRPDRHRKGI